jgi:hypothetical protein
VTARNPGPGAGSAGPELPTPGSPDGPEPGMPGIPGDADRDEDVDVLTLAGQIPADDGEWLLVTALDAAPGAEFAARHLRRDELHAHGGDVLVRLVPAGKAGLPQVGAQVWTVLSGRLILAGSWDRQDIGRWPEQIRPAVAFAMGTLTELEENGADLGPYLRVRLDDPDTATVGVPFGITSRRAAPAGLPPG